MANQFLTRQEVTRETLMVLENNCTILPYFYRDLDQEFGKKGAKIGDTIYVLKPARFVGRDGQAYSPEPLTDTQVPITINQQSGVDFEFSTAEKFESLDQFKKKYLDKAGTSLANKLDFRCGQTAMQNTANLVGTPGVTPGLSGSDAFQIYAQAGQKLDEMGFPLKGYRRTMVITPAMRVGDITFTKQFFNPSDALSQQWKTGQISNMLGYAWFVDQNIPTQTIGLLGGTPAVSGASQIGTAINLSGLTASVTGWANVGDVITFAGAAGVGTYAVNPQNRTSTGSLQDFVVQTQVNSDGSGLATINIMPAIVPSGQFQNVTNSPANGALVSVYHTAAAGQAALAGLNTPQGLLYVDEAMAFVSFPGDVPENVDMGFEDRSGEIGVSLRFCRTWDSVRDMWTNRFDVYYGIGPLYMEGCCRIAA